MVYCYLESVFCTIAIYHLVVKKVWTPWGEWGACSVTCGGGGQRRYRTCMTKTIYGHHSGTVNHCTGSSYRKRRCNTHKCYYPRVYHY